MKNAHCPDIAFIRISVSCRDSSLAIQVTYRILLAGVRNKLEWGIENLFARLYYANKLYRLCYLGQCALSLLDRSTSHRYSHPCLLKLGALRRPSLAAFHVNPTPPPTPSLWVILTPPHPLLLIQPEMGVIEFNCQICFRKLYNGIIY